MWWAEMKMNVRKILRCCHVRLMKDDWLTDKLSVRTSVTNLKPVASSQRFLIGWILGQIREGDSRELNPDNERDNGSFWLVCWPTEFWGKTYHMASLHHLLLLLLRRSQKSKTIIENPEVWHRKTCLQLASFNITELWCMRRTLALLNTKQKKKRFCQAKNDFWLFHRHFTEHGTATNICSVNGHFWTSTTTTTAWTWRTVTKWLPANTSL